MIKIIKKIIFLLAVAITCHVFADELNDGMRAWERRDYTSAIDKFTRVALQGNAEAQIRLGFINYYGLGIEKNYQQAIYWFRMAADNGNTDAQFILGAMYVRAEGVVQDYKQAMFWHTKAAEIGNAEAQNSVGSMYFE